MKSISLFLLLFIGFAATSQNVQIETYDCGVTINSLSQLIRCNGIPDPSSVGIDYQFEVSDGTTTATVDRNYHTVSLAMAGFSAYSGTYTFKARAKLTTSPTYGPWSSTCSSTMSTTPPTITLANCVTTGTGTTMGTFNSNFFANTAPGATGYTFQFNVQGDPTVVATVTNPTWKTMNLATAGLYTTGTIYEVRVKGVFSGGTSSNYGSACLIQAPTSLPTTSLVGCGVTDYQLQNYGQTILATPVAGATAYEFTFTDVTNGAGGAVYTYTNNTFRSATLALAGISTPFASFDVQVRVKYGSGPTAVWSGLGSVCQIFTPTDVPLVYLDLATSCGAQLATNAGTIIESVITPYAYEYIFEFVNQSDGLLTTTIYTSATNAIPNLDAVFGGAGLAPLNTTYNVRVKANIDLNNDGDNDPLTTTADVAFGVYGYTCFINSEVTIPQPQLTSASCGQTLASVATNFSSAGVAGATQYEFEFKDFVTGNLVTTFTKNYHTISLNEVGLTAYNSGYDVRVKVNIGTVAVPDWGDYGNTCSIHVGNIPTSSLLTCGATLTRFNENFSVANISGATEYGFRFQEIGSGTITLYDDNWHTIHLLDAGLLTVGAQYNVEVRAKVAGTWGPYGTACQLNAPTSVPNTNLLASVCGTTVAGYTTIMPAQHVAGASLYEYEFAGPDSTWTVTKNYQNISFAQAGISLITTAKTYAISVRARVSGTWGAFSSACNVTAPATIVPPVTPMILAGGNTSGNATMKSGEVNTNNEATTVAANISLNVYPNPTSDIVNIQTDLNAFNVSIYNTNGQLVYTANAMNSIHKVSLGEFAKGLYVVQVKDNNGLVLQTEKLSVIK
ncbi:hypothetical protein DNU06_00245 [Putridiphycobacter roseus]|uniref:Secretion system C-terminal sorting domain-containing protein n=1 Tax=Putridiphycobacter roseus TaxID=2219161 RepID=A0A2W1N3Y3_9FLAO|nr:T9SS type A sorting domain-containing protein [Putridiphycobacter roseus]PZE18300.1 hypothetical protein DNU06_00245 [Putridiphycobacter roseus]